MVDFIGRDGSVVLFSNGSDAVAINTDLNLVVGVGDHAALSAARPWEATNETLPESLIELASGAVTTLDINVITASARMYTIPDGAKAEAKRALEWRKEHKRGGTPVGLNTARTLARGGQIGIEKIRHIAKYFPRHEVDKKGKGWKPGQDNFPSNGRIAWALWGGDAAWRWARAIVERENKKSVTAGGYALPGYQDSLETYKTAGSYGASIDPFKDAFELEENYGPEFMARVCMDGSGVDRLYKVDADGKVCVWDDGVWDDMGHVDGDVWSYDQALDDPYDHGEKDHFLVDPESALYISAMLQANPHGKVRIEDMDPDEAQLVADGMEEEDFQMLDYALTAAGDSMSGSKPTGAVKAGDGQYTGAERSAIASQAPRDATGKFAKAGGRAVIGNDASKGAGTIVGRSNTPGNIRFKLDATGKTIDIPAKFSTPEDKFVAPKAPSVDYGKPLNVDGILGEPRTPQSMPNAQLPGTLPPMTPGDLKNVLNDWDGYVAEQRASFKPLTDKQVRQYAKDTNQKVREVGSETRTPLPNQKGGAAGTVTTVKDGKLTSQPAPATAPSRPKSGPQPKSATAPARPKSGPQPVSATPPSGVTVKAQGAGTAKAFKPADNLVPGSPNMSRVKAPVIPVKPATALRKVDMSKGTENLLPGSPNMSRVKGPVLPVKPATPLRKIDMSKGTENLLPGAPNMSRVTAPTSKTAPGPDRVERNAPKPGPDRVERMAPKATKPGPDRVERNIPKPGPDRPERMVPKPSTSSKPSSESGKYVVKKGDSLWSIAEKYKPKGETTASYWAKVMKANPKSQFKSGNPSLIYSGEKVNLPGVNIAPPAPATKPPAKKTGPGPDRVERGGPLSPPVKQKPSPDRPERMAPKPGPDRVERGGPLSPPVKRKPSPDRPERMAPKPGPDRVERGGPLSPPVKQKPGPDRVERNTPKPGPDQVERNGSRDTGARPKPKPGPDRVERNTPKPGPDRVERNGSKPISRAPGPDRVERNTPKPGKDQVERNGSRDTGTRPKPTPSPDRVERGGVKPGKDQVERNGSRDTGVRPKAPSGPDRVERNGSKPISPAPGPDRVERNTPKPSGVGLNPVKPGIPKSLQKPAPRRGKSGSRKRYLPEG